MTLIEMVRKARKNGHGFIAVDANLDAYSYLFEPHGLMITWTCEAYAWKILGEYNLTCDWKDSLIDITKLKGIK